MPTSHNAADLLPLHPMDLRIVMAVWDHPSYGTRIVEEIESSGDSGPVPYPANLFRRVRDLLAKGILEDAPAPQGADPRRSYVRLTALGREVGRAEVHRLQGLLAEAAARRMVEGA